MPRRILMIEDEQSGLQPVEDYFSSAPRTIILSGCGAATGAPAWITELSALRGSSRTWHISSSN